MARRPMLFATLRGLARDPEGKVLLGSAITTVAVGTVAYMFLEGWSAVDALYFSVVTLATVGFGDLHPTTDEAKLFTVGYIIFGVGILAGFVSEVARRRSERTSTPVIDRVEQAVVTRRRGRDAAGEDAASAPAASSDTSSPPAP